jgi:hypothetical protein
MIFTLAANLSGSKKRTWATDPMVNLSSLPGSDHSGFNRFEFCKHFAGATKISLIIPADKLGVSHGSAW